MKAHSAPSLFAALALTLLINGFAIAQSPSSTADRTGKRPKFTSKIHIPVKLAAEVASLPPAGYQLVFEDEFNGDQIDTQKWGFRTDSKLLSTQQRENISVKGGNLEIALRKETVKGKSYTAGGVISKKTFVYGYYEARFKTPPVEGWHTAFWSMKHSFPDQPKRQALLELDCCEQDGGDPNFFSFGIINQRPDPKKRQSWNGGRWVIEDAPDTSAKFHVWACEFTPDTTRFYFDGRLTKDLSSAGFSHDGVATSRTPTGPFEYKGYFLGNHSEFGTGDFAIFTDTDGAIYHIAVRKPDKALVYGRLSEDGLKPVGEYKVLEGVTIGTEAPAFFRRGGKVYLLGSGTSGWKPNPARLFVADRFTGPYKEIPNPCHGVNPINQLGPDKTFGGQSTYVYPVAGRQDAWVAMFDINQPDDPINAGYVWLPVEFEGENPVIRWRDQWDLSVFSKR